MITFCDIGNTTYHFLQDDCDFKESVFDFDETSIVDKVFYICVNKEIDKRLQKLPNWIDLEPYIDRSLFYDTMGVDRIMACMGVENGVVVDVGSAITVDIVIDSSFQGGFIYPGIDAMQKTYRNISSLLDYSFNFDCNLDKLPKNSKDSISYGYLKTLQNEVLSYGMDILLTGGDSEKFSKIFIDATIDKLLIFKGMKKIYSKLSKSLA